VSFRLLLAVLGLIVTASPRQESSRFAAIEIFIDSGARPLAAYQIELTADPGTMKLVGVEGNPDLSFQNPPYYDPAALREGERIVLAAFTTEAPPSGRTRIATVHVCEAGNKPNYSARLIVAGDPEGKPIEALVSFERQGESP